MNELTCNKQTEKKQKTDGKKKADGKKKKFKNRTNIQAYQRKEKCKLDMNKKGQLCGDGMM